MCGQKAPSAKRCIKTASYRLVEEATSSQKAPSAKRCIKTAHTRAVYHTCYTSESTERQKVHYDCQTRGTTAPSFCESESTERQKVH